MEAASSELKRLETGSLSDVVRTEPRTPPPSLWVRASNQPNFTVRCHKPAFNGIPQDIWPVLITSEGVSVLAALGSRPDSPVGDWTGRIRKVGFILPKTREVPLMIPYAPFLVPLFWK